MFPQASEAVASFSKELTRCLVQLAVAATVTKVISHIKDTAQNYAIINVPDDENDDVKQQGDDRAQFFVQGMDRKYTLDFSPSRTVESVFDEVSRKTGLLGHEYLLVFSGRSFSQGGTLSDHNVQRGSTVFVGLRLGGSGKRGVGRMKSDKTKDEVISDLEDSMSRTGSSLAGCRNQALLSAIQRINTLKTNVIGNANHAQYMLTQCSDDQLKTLNSSFGGSGSRDYKTGIYKNLVFAEDLKNLKQLSSDGELIKTAMDEVIYYVIVQGYGNEKGEVAWTKIQEHILDILRDRARVDGAAAASADAAGAASMVP